MHKSTTKKNCGDAGCTLNSRCTHKIIHCTKLQYTYTYIFLQHIDTYSYNILLCTWLQLSGGLQCCKYANRSEHKNKTNRYKVKYMHFYFICSVPSPSHFSAYLHTAHTTQYGHESINLYNSFKYTYYV